MEDGRGYVNLKMWQIVSLDILFVESFSLNLAKERLTNYK